MNAIITAASRTSENDLSKIPSLCRIGATAMLLLAGVPLARAQSTPPAPKSGQDAWDLNHDGVNTCDEWKSYVDRVFKIADRNHDGRLDQAEFATIRQKEGPFADADFGYFDENQDGKITHDEFVSKPSEFILRFDRNGDCRVTPDEMKPQTDPNAPKERPRDKWH
jgi:Ca2+-binding EF-hand superfamily protein